MWSRGKQFCFPGSPDVRTRGKIKLTNFPRDQTLSALMYVWMFPSTIAAKQANAGNNCCTFEFEQGHVTKNQPITVHVLLSESPGI